MKHKHIDTLAQKFIVDSASRPANPRMQEIMLRLTADLMKLIEDLEVTDDEVWAALDYIDKAGKNDETHLISAGLGLDRFLDIRLEEAEVRYGIGGGTPRSIEGPLYVHGAPTSTYFARLDDGSEADKGQVFFMQGKVSDIVGVPIPGAVVEVWHANTEGECSYFDKTQSEFNLRRTIIADDQGRYRFQSILPDGYGVPEGGCTEALLNELGRHGQRPPHLHFFIHANGYRKLTTQINLPGSPYTFDDYAFADRPGLVPPMKLVQDQKIMEENGVQKPFFLIEYDFRLNPEVHGAPSADVERSRALDHKDPTKGSQDAESYYIDKLPKDK